MPAPGEARADWLILSQFALRMGYDGFGYASAAEIFTEHASLSAWRNNAEELPRAFNIGALATLGESAYDALQPTQWPAIVAADAAPSERPFADGRFFHADGRARFVATVPRAPGQPARR